MSTDTSIRLDFETQGAELCAAMCRLDRSATKTLDDVDSRSGCASSSESGPRS